jgi:hypothetical protein
MIEPVTGSRHRETGAGGLSVGLTAEGATPAEAVDRLGDQVRTRVNAGAKLAELSVAADAGPYRYGVDRNPEPDPGPSRRRSSKPVSAFRLAYL